jgi:thiamine pyrophosphate-dependent acetolactate synthase large subunit-like protein
MENGHEVQAPFFGRFPYFQFIKHAESFRVKGHRISQSYELLRTIKFALEDDEISIIAAPTAILKA